MTYTKEYLNENLRRCLENKATFEELSPPQPYLLAGRIPRRQVKILQPIRAYNRRLDAEVSKLIPAKPIGTEPEGNTRQVAHLTFTFHNGQWEAETSHLEIHILPETPEPDVEQWLHATLDLPDAAYHHSPSRQSGKTLHILGKQPYQNRNIVALADPEHDSVTWHLHPAGRLFATAIAEASRNYEKPVSLNRIILHETTHLHEPEMKDWLNTITHDIKDLVPIRHKETSDSIAKFCFELNGDLLVPRIQTWKKQHDLINDAERKHTLKKDDANQMRHYANESMAAEILVETYLSTIWFTNDPKPKTKWHTVDKIASEMKNRNAGFEKLFTPIHALKSDYPDRMADW
jgi:hypothetical protein